MIDVAEIFEVFDCEMVPFHEEYTGHEAVSDENTDAGKVVLAKLAPETLVEAADAVVSVGGALAVGDAVEEVAVVSTFLPHALHFGAAGLKVAKVLLAEAGLFIDLDAGAAERRGAGIVRGQGGEDAFGGFAGAAVGRSEDLKGVIGAEEFAKSASSVVGLVPAFGGEFHPVIGDGLVDVFVFVSFGLSMADQDDQPRFCHGGRNACGRFLGVEGCFVEGCLQADVCSEWCFSWLVEVTERQHYIE